MFEGKATVHHSLSELIENLRGSEGGGDWFGNGTLPADVTLESLAFSYLAPPPSSVQPAAQPPPASLFSIRSDIGVSVTNGPAFKLAFAFAKRDHAVLVGLCSRGRIDLSSAMGSDTGLIGRFLGNSISIASASTTPASRLTRSMGPCSICRIRRIPTPSRSPWGRRSPPGSATPKSIIDIALPPPGAEKTGAAASPPQPAVFGPSSGAAVTNPKAESAGPLRYWKDLDKTIGPLQFRRIGGEWDGTQGKFGILLDAAVSLAGLSVGLAGLCVKVAPSKLSTLKFDDLEFGLDGLELAFVRGPVTISGALLKTFEGKRVGYAGQASIRAATFAIAAIGAYSTTEEGQPAFFIFGAFVGILGGPPCFVVEGIAAGFGYNRAIALPGIDGVGIFPWSASFSGRPSRAPPTC